MRRRTKLALVIVGIVAALGLVYALALFAFVDSFRMIPQDCLLLERSFLVHVSDALTGQPVSGAHLTIRNLGGRGFEGGAIAFDSLTDDKGTYSENKVHVFACDTVIAEASAEGYESHQASYDGDVGYNESAVLEAAIKLVPKPQ